jgi:elongation factor Ts
MQVAAMKPEYIAEKDIPQDRLAKEKEIFTAEANKTNAGKPADIIEKIVMGKIKKLAKEITLLGQEFVKESSTTIEKLLKAANADVINMVRYEVGEGIEKRADNFAEEVMSQVQGS